MIMLENECLVYQSDEKNIRRRVYDALNVLLALDIIARDKKDIHWKGLPSTNVQDLEKIKVATSFYSSLNNTQFQNLSLSHTYTLLHVNILIYCGIFGNLVLVPDLCRHCMLGS